MSRSDSGSCGGGGRKSDRPPVSSSPTLPMVDTSFADTVERLKDSRPTLLVLAGPVMGARIALTGAPTVFGRSGECDVPIPDEGVSQRHFEIALGPTGKFELRDLGSLNGTLVNGEKIECAVLEPGDRILVGHTPMRFLLYTPAEDDLLNDLELRAMQDPLTGLFNRRYFDQRIEQELKFAARHGTRVSLLLLDIDHFKAVTDGWGHPVGDHLLLELGSYIRSCVRTEDVVARFGGEEFALIIRQVDETGAVTLAERLRAGIEAFPFVQAGNRIPITVSIGIATIVGRRECEKSDLVEAADRELTRAKEQGRNRVCTTTL